MSSWTDGIRRWRKHSSYCLFLRCHECSRLGLVKFQHKAQFTFLGLVNEPERARLVWLSGYFKPFPGNAKIPCILPPQTNIHTIHRPACSGDVRWMYECIPITVHAGSDSSITSFASGAWRSSHILTAEKACAQSFANNLSMVSSPITTNYHEMISSGVVRWFKWLLITGDMPLKYYPESKHNMRAN